mmetsp:Transcript_24637/g.67014  ORF Transcript_24637/g.67014 Transcript_24637/m.67014 type:complete len:401 (+) Transcript_24637:1835-3037(+)
MWTTTVSGEWWRLLKDRCSPPWRARARPRHSRRSRRWLRRTPPCSVSPPRPSPSLARQPMRASAPWRRWASAIRSKWRPWPPSTRPPRGRRVPRRRCPCSSAGCAPRRCSVGPPTTTAWPRSWNACQPTVRPLCRSAIRCCAPAASGAAALWPQSTRRSASGTRRLRSRWRPSLPSPPHRRSCTSMPRTSSAPLTRPGPGPAIGPAAPTTCSRTSTPLRSPQRPSSARLAPPARSTSPWCSRASELTPGSLRATIPTANLPRRSWTPCAGSCARATGPPSRISSARPRARFSRPLCAARSPESGLQRRKARVRAFSPCERRPRPPSPNRLLPPTQPPHSQPWVPVSDTPTMDFHRRTQSRQWRLQTAMALLPPSTKRWTCPPVLPRQSESTSSSPGRVPR